MVVDMKENISMDGNKIKHLEMIQGVILRMATNSFTLKGWAVSLVAALFALAGKDVERTYFFFITYIPILVFWGLDSYYLLQEKKYRALYEKVRNQDEKEIDFCMDANSLEFGKGLDVFNDCILSPTEKWFYLPLAVVTLLVIIITHM